LARRLTLPVMRSELPLALPARRSERPEQLPRRHSATLTLMIGLMGMFVIPALGSGAAMVDGISAGEAAGVFCC